MKSENGLKQGFVGQKRIGRWVVYQSDNPFTFLKQTPLDTLVSIVRLSSVDINYLINVRI